jgi:hypothetical protein
MEKLKALVDVVAKYPLFFVGVILLLVAAVGVVPLALVSRGTNLPIVGQWRSLLSVVGITALVFEGARLWRTPNTHPSLAKVIGGFTHPAAGSTVSSSLSSAGWAKNLEAGLRLWLIVEVGTHKWPKGDELRLEGDGNWRSEVYEDGTGDAFSLSLYVANDEGQRKIRAWLEIGTLIGYHPFEVDIPGTRRLARLSGLRK